MECEINRGTIVARYGLTKVWCQRERMCFIVCEAEKNKSKKKHVSKTLVWGSCDTKVWFAMKDRGSNTILRTTHFQVTVF